ncbi:MAG: alpha/beta hydrolase, partial [Acidobacteriota bacterium]
KTARRPGARARASLWLIIFGLALGGSPTELLAGEDPGPGLRLAPCPFDDGDGLLCGVLEVFEDRQRQSGRKIPLNVVLMPSRSPEPRGTGSGGEGETGSKALFVLAGGPGVAATDWGRRFVNGALDGVRATRDVVLVDQRGTGGSNGLRCPLYEGDSPSSLWGDLLPVEPIERCRRALEERADLRFYGSAFAADDLDDVRAALGYAQIDLYGSSYGSHLAQVYMRRHPDRVRSAVLQGVAPVDARSLEEIPHAAQAALDGLVSRCAADPACRSAYPRFEQQLAAVFDRLRADAVQVPWTAPGNDEPDVLTLTYDHFALVLRGLLHHPAAAATIPRIVDAAAGGDFGPFVAPSLTYRRALADGIAFGLFLSVFCEEQVRSADLEAADAAAEASFAGEYWTEQLVRACAAWPRGILPAGHDQPLRSAAPTLLISGGLDPATPPHWARSVAVNLPKSRLLVFPHASHSLGGLVGCVDELVVDFLDRGSAHGLDASCIDDLEPPPFLLP